eukprot:Partr_v1_DN26315_c0_g1_i3_m42922 putative transcription factor
MDEEKGYSWTDQYKRSWDVIHEDAQGSLTVSDGNHQFSPISASMQEMMDMRRRWVEKSRGCQRGILRNVFVVVDMSLAMADKDFKPSYLDLTCSLLRQFVVEFYDQNPISQLAMIITRDGVAQKLSDLSGNPRAHLDVLESLLKSSTMLKGEPSLVNSLQLARTSLLHSPSHSSKEILMIMASLTSRDPSDLSETIDQIKSDGIACSIIGLAAEIHICKRICQETGGYYSVAMHEDHFKQLLWDRIPPPIIVSQRASSFVLMGFPQRFMETSLCACHGNITSTGYRCPRCLSKQCHLPSDCSICDLKLISAPHLARSYHHLFPILPYSEVSIPAGGVRSAGCFSCFSPFATRGFPKGSVLSKAQSVSAAVSPNEASRSKQLKLTLKLPASDIVDAGNVYTVGYQCRHCLRLFCLACDVFIHETLHTCPGCGDAHLAN